MEVSKILNEKSTPAIPAEPPSLASTGPQYGTIQSLVEAQEERRRGLQHKPDRKSTRLNSSHVKRSRMPSSA